MIVSFKDDWLAAFFIEDLRARRIPADIKARLFSAGCRCLTMR